MELALGLVVLIQQATRIRARSLLHPLHPHPTLQREDQRTDPSRDPDISNQRKIFTNPHQVRLFLFIFWNDENVLVDSDRSEWCKVKLELETWIQFQLESEKIKFHSNNFILLCPLSWKRKITKLKLLLLKREKWVYYSSKEFLLNIQDWDLKLNCFEIIIIY